VQQRRNSSIRRNDPGIRRHGPGWEVRVYVAGVSYCEYFPLDTPKTVMRDWRAAQKARALPTRAGSFAADVAVYLKTVQHMPTFTERRKHLEEWLAVLGRDRSRATITTTEVDTALSAWLTQPRSDTDTRPLAPVSVRHRRTALLHLYRTLDGRSARNPVAESRRPPDPAPEPRAVPLDRIRAVLAAMQPSASRARIMVLLATGLPHASLMAIKPEHVDTERRVVRVPARRKGKGAASRLLPLSDAALAAFRELATWDAWGKFSQSALHMAVRRACKRVGVPHFRVYDLRHTAGTLIYQQTGDLATTARLLGHSTTKITERYTTEAHVGMDALASVALGQALARVLPLGMDLGNKENSE
jgi:integrase